MVMAMGLVGTDTYTEYPFLTRETADQLEARKQAEQEAEKRQNQPVVTSLANHIRSAFTTNVADRSEVTERMLKCLRQRKGIYEPDVQAMIDKINGTKIYMMLTDIKCRALESWMKDILIPAGDRPFSITPTPVPEVPQQIVQKAQQAFMTDYMERMSQQAYEAGIDEISPDMIDPDDLMESAKQFEKELLKVIREQAAESAERIEQTVDDEFREGGWYKKLSEFIGDFATYPTAFIEGPIYRRRPVLSWKPIDGMLQSELAIEQKIVKEYDRIRPFDVYPSPGARTLQDGNLCILRRHSRADLNALRGVDGYDSDAINLVLEQYQSGYKEFVNSDSEMEDLQNRPSEWSNNDGNIDCIKFYGSVQGFKLREWGMGTDKIPDPFREYPVIAYLVGSYVIGARINPHPLGRRNIYCASFKKENDSIWGMSIPELMADIQSLCNSLARAICNNAAIASGPQMWVWVDMIPPECDRDDIYPWKIWEFSSEKTKASGQRPMDFFQPPLIVSELQGTYHYFFQQASEVTGIPSYVYGNEGIGGAGNTASGLSMLMNAASKGLRNAASNIDAGVISPSVEEHWLTVMLEKPELATGDCKIVARASEYLVQQESLQIRRTEFLNATNNQIDAQIIGIDGRRELLRENVKSLKMNPDKIVPTREDMISTQVEMQTQQIVSKLSHALNMPPEQLLQLLQAPMPSQGQGQGQNVQQQPRELDAAGNPVAGQDVRQFNQ